MSRRAPGAVRLRRASSRLRWDAGIFALVAAKLFLVSVLPLRALTEASYDDALFVRSARAILAGEWLGPYDPIVLAKGPMYPLFIAASHLMGLPLTLTQQLLYVSFCLVLAAALRAFANRGMTLLAFAVALFNPASFGSGELSRVVREPVYAAFTGLAVAS